MIKNHESYLDDGWEVQSPLDGAVLENNSTITAFTPEKQLPDGYDPNTAFSDPKSSGGGLIGSVQKMITDGEAALSDRIDLIPKGFCSAYMTKNINLAWGSNNTRILPFDGQIGPSSGAHIIDPGRIVFDEPGTWTVHALVSGRETGYTGNDLVHAVLRLFGPDGTAISTRKSIIWAGSYYCTLAFTQPLIVAQAGSWIDVEAWSGRWRWWDGGTRLSNLTVIKSQNGFINNGSETVGDESR